MLNVYSMENCQKGINISSTELWKLTLSYVEIKGQLDATDWFFIAKLIIFTY